MRNPKSLVERFTGAAASARRGTSRPHTTRSAFLKAAQEAGRAALCLALVGQSLLVPGATARAQQARSAAQTRPAQSAAPNVVPGIEIRPAGTAVVNFKQLAERQARSRVANTPATGLAIHPPLTIQEVDTPSSGAVQTSDATTGGGDVVGAPAPSEGDTGGPLVPSPTPAQSFLAQEDGPKVGTTTFTIPPDTMGAVGIDKVFTQTNSNFRIHDKSTGAPLSTVNSDTFWAPSGGTGFFDPRVVYDPFNNRWLTAIASNAGAATSALELGISDTSDPQGSYHMYRFVVGCAAGAAGCNANGEYADFPMLGFNKNWVTISWNQFTINTNAFISGQIIAVDYPALRSNTLNSYRFTGISSANGGFCMHGAATLDPNETTLYFVSHISSAGGTYKLSTLTGNPPSLGGGAPTVTIGTTQTRTINGQGGWTQPGGDILPQTCTGTAGVTCPTTLRFMDVGDSFVRTNVVSRGGKIYYAQTVGIGASPGATLTHTAAQWTVLNSTGVAVDGGRVEDATATNSNGGKWYAYPSIASNHNGDIMVGYGQFASNQFASAGYSYRLATDAAGAMRDPVIYKAGEDYYSKAFSGTRNRWGDYSHTVVDPVNDLDMWTIQEYAQPRTTPDANTTTNNSRWGTWWAKVAATAGGNNLLISEFRLRGPVGANDEFVEIYNNTDAPHTVNAIDGSAGYSLVASDGTARFTIPNGTVIPARGHYLGVNSVGYSLGSYPAGNGTTASGDATYTVDIPDNAGIALFRSASSFTLANRLDAAGSTSEANTLYKEGAGYPALTPFSIDYSFYRNQCGFSGGICTTGGLPKDTNDNAADFLFVDTNGTSAGAGQRLGAPGPENLSSPIIRTNQMPLTLLDPSVAGSNPPNRVRDLTSDPANNSTFGTLSIRRTVTNNTGAAVTRLRFRIIDLTTFPAPSGTADLRARTSSTVVVTVTGTNPGCPGTGSRPCTVQGTTLEEPPSQPNGGAFNSTLSAGTVTLATPVAPGTAINVQFLLGVQQTGSFRFLVNVEALP